MLGRDVIKSEDEGRCPVSKGELTVRLPLGEPCNCTVSRPQHTVRGLLGSPCNCNPVGRYLRQNREHTSRKWDSQVQRCCRYSREANTASFYLSLNLQPPCAGRVARASITEADHQKYVRRFRFSLATQWLWRCAAQLEIAAAAFRRGRRAKALARQSGVPRMIMGLASKSPAF